MKKQTKRIILKNNRGLLEDYFGDLELYGIDVDSISKERLIKLILEAWNCLYESKNIIEQEYLF